MVPGTNTIRDEFRVFAAHIVTEIRKKRYAVQWIVVSVDQAVLSEVAD
jgi:hypothetical protein